MKTNKKGTSSAKPIVVTLVVILVVWFCVSLFQAISYKQAEQKAIDEALEHSGYKVIENPDETPDYMKVYQD